MENERGREGGASEPGRGKGREQKGRGGEKQHLREERGREGEHTRERERGREQEREIQRWTVLVGEGVFQTGQAQRCLDGAWARF